MRKSRFSEARIVEIIRESKAGSLTDSGDLIPKWIEPVAIVAGAHSLADCTSPSIMRGISVQRWQ